MITRHEAKGLGNDVWIYCTYGGHVLMAEYGIQVGIEFGFQIEAFWLFLLLALHGHTTRYAMLQS